MNTEVRLGTAVHRTLHSHNGTKADSCHAQNPTISGNSSCRCHENMPSFLRSPPACTPAAAWGRWACPTPRRCGWVTQSGGQAGAGGQLCPTADALHNQTLPGSPAWDWQRGNETSISISQGTPKEQMLKGAGVGPLTPEKFCGVHCNCERRAVGPSSVNSLPVGVVCLMRCDTATLHCHPPPPPRQKNPTKIKAQFAHELRRGYKSMAPPNCMRQYSTCQLCWVTKGRRETLVDRMHVLSHLFPDGQAPPN